MSEMGYSRHLPGKRIAAQVQYQAERRAAERNQRLMEQGLAATKARTTEAGGALQQGLGLLQSYRPGGAAALASPYYGQMASQIYGQGGREADIYAGMRQEAPDLMFAYRDAARKSQNRMAKRGQWMSLAGSVIGAAGSALSGAFAAGGRWAGGGKDAPTGDAKAGGGFGFSMPGTSAASQYYKPPEEAKAGPLISNLPSQAGAPGGLAAAFAGQRQPSPVRGQDYPRDMGRGFGLGLGDGPPEGGPPEGGGGGTGAPPRTPPEGGAGGRLPRESVSVPGPGPTPYGSGAEGPLGATRGAATPDANIASMEYGQRQQVGHPSGAYSDDAGLAALGMELTNPNAALSFALKGMEGEGSSMWALNLNEQVDEVMGFGIASQFEDWGGWS